MFVYADNAATTCISQTALDAMMPYLIRESFQPLCIRSGCEGSNRGCP